jgi:hypothetical protein
MAHRKTITVTHSMPASRRLSLRPPARRIRQRDRPNLESI